MKTEQKIEDIFLKNLPTLDLHGYTKDMAKVATKDFILENITLGNKKILIIHGIGRGIVKEGVHEELSQNKDVSKYYVDGFNIGCTIIELNNKR